MTTNDVSEFFAGVHDLTKFVWASAIGWLLIGTLVPPSGENIDVQLIVGLTLLTMLLVTTLWEWNRSTDDSEYRFD